MYQSVCNVSDHQISKGVAKRGLAEQRYKCKDKDNTSAINEPSLENTSYQIDGR
jgi:hypothetical protein